MGEIPWRNISIADLLTILHDAFDISFGSLAMKIIASYNSLYKKGFPGHQPDDQTVRRWAREECIPVEKKYLRVYWKLCFLSVLLTQVGMKILFLLGLS